MYLLFGLVLRQIWYFSLSFYNRQIINLVDFINCLPSLGSGLNPYYFYTLLAAAFICVFLFRPN